MNQIVEDLGTIALLAFITIIASVSFVLRNIIWITIAVLLYLILQRV